MFHLLSVKDGRSLMPIKNKKFLKNKLHPSAERPGGRGQGGLWADHQIQGAPHHPAQAETLHPSKANYKQEPGGCPQDK